jgi:hypothetical protein
MTVFVLSFAVSIVANDADLSLANALSALASARRCCGIPVVSFTTASYVPIAKAWLEHTEAVHIGRAAVVLLTLLPNQTLAQHGCATLFASTRANCVEVRLPHTNQLDSLNSFWNLRSELITRLLLQSRLDDALIFSDSDAIW